MKELNEWIKSEINPEYREEVRKTSMMENDIEAHIFRANLNNNVNFEYFEL